MATTRIFAALAALLLSHGAAAQGWDFSVEGQGEMGLVGGSDYEDPGLSPYAGLEVIAELSFEFDGGTTVGIVGSFEVGADTNGVNTRPYRHSHGNIFD